MTSSLKVACIIPTYNGREDLQRLLISLNEQKGLFFDILIVDSTSTDGTYELALAHNSNVVRIPSSDFNHGGTRQLIASQNPNYDIFIYLTQDAYLEDQHALCEITKPFADPKVGAVCGRQLPHHNATLLSQHARYFNYPKISQMKTLSDSSELGLKTAFVSNSFTAYRSNALKEAGGFPKHVILSEDMYVASKMLICGWKIAYAGEARCRHSHNYTISEEFRRYFDQGVFHGRESWIRENFGGAGGEGLRYVKSELQFLGLNRLYLWPAALLRNACKLIAYKLGQKEKRMPIAIKKKMSMHKGYWKSPHAKNI